MWCRQLKVVLWKNLVIRKRHWFLLLCESLIPVLLFVLIAYGRSQITGLSKQDIVDVTHNEKYEISYESIGFNLADTQIYYSPTTKYYEDIIHRVQEKFQIINNNIRGFDSQETLLETYARSSNSTVIAIIFNTRNTTNFDYTIRYHKEYPPWKTDALYENAYQFSPGAGSRYLWEGLLALQKALDISFIEKEKESRGGHVPTFRFEALEFPYPPHKVDSGLSSIFIHYYPLVTLFSFIFVCPAVLKRVVEEKHSGIKELMKMIGMKSPILWFGWFVYSMIPMILSVCIITLILKVDLFDAGYPPIEYSNASVLMAFLILYCMASIVICFFLSSIFAKPTLSTLVGLLLWILSYFVPKYALEDSESNESQLPFSTNIALMLLPNMALHYGYAAMSRYEEREIGVQWTNWHKPGGGGSNEITMLQVCLMLVFDCVLYMLLALWLDDVNPGRYGVPKSFFYPFKAVYSKLVPKKIKIQNDPETCYLSNIESGQVRKGGIELDRLTKQYGKRTVVDNLSMVIDQNRITVLLGHNGAGKSTTMGMITGMIKKTSGHIFMNGDEITSRSDVTDSIGLCPQHSLFFSDLTVAEHLKFFAMLKGRSRKDAEIELKELLTRLNMIDKRNESAFTLSGGMKRKLCLGMAVIGGSKILILDEPSSGMDIQSRRHLWDLLLGWRNERTILITTHFMEEADALADYIFIMDEGKIDSQGTPYDLKKKHETGYSLNLMIDQNENPEVVAQRLEKEIRSYVCGVQLKGVHGSEVSFLIPCSDKNVNKTCQEMFEHLETNKEKFKIENISLSNTTLEDVFLKSRQSDSNDKSEYKDNELEFARDFQDSSKIVFWALLTKRNTFLRRKWLHYFIPSLIAFAFLCLSIFLGQLSSYSASSGGPPFKIALSSYGKTKVFFGDTNNAGLTKMMQIYKGLVTKEKSDFVNVEDVDAAIVREGIRNLPFYRHHMITAAEMSLKGSDSKTNIEAVVMYNNMAKHSAPISLNLVTNSIAKLILGEEYSIHYTNHPLDNINSQIFDDELSEAKIGLLWLIILPLGCLFFLGSFIYFPYVELSTNFTQLQLMCGVSPFIYWSATFISDLLVYVLFAVLMTIFSLAWTPFCGINEAGGLFLILVLYGTCGIPYSYLFGRLKSFTGGYALFIILGIMLGVILTVIVIVLEESGDVSYIKLGNIFKIVFMIFCPQFGLTYSGVAFSRKAIKTYNFDHMSKFNRISVCSRNDASPCCFENGPVCNAYKSYLAVLSPHIWLMLLGAAIYLVLNLLLHSYWLRKVFNKLLNLLQRRSTSLKEDLSLSRVDIHTGDNNDKTLRVTKLRKFYSGKMVVNDLKFALKKGECLGLLGVNGAGKTTTFRMLTRDAIKDDGNIKINNTHIDNAGYLKKLGYCPQNDALNFSLTGREILQTIAMLRGIKNNEEIVNTYLRILDLTDIADQPCGTYSGGNKRKLSFAVAIIGLPPFILLDEPTTGVDPSSRRKLWTLIKQIKDRNDNSFILTSHSMTECEALCNDLVIMKEGHIEKEGTIAKLKNEICGYSAKFLLRIPSTSNTTLELNEEGNDEVDGHSIPLIGKNTDQKIKDVKQLKDYLKETYGGEVKDEHSGLLHFYIKNKFLRWSQLFRNLEDLKLRSDGFIKEYFISEASLEDVFLDVAKQGDDIESAKLL